MKVKTKVRGRPTLTGEQHVIIIRTREWNDVDNIINALTPQERRDVLVMAANKKAPRDANTTGRDATGA